MGRPVVLALFFWLTSLRLAGAAEWISAEDQKALDDAEFAVNYFCSGGFQGDLDREAGRDSLEANVGGENAIKDVLSGAKDTDEISTRAQNTFTPVWLVMQVGSVIFAFLLIILWWFCCWSACPCCKCCRCCAKERKTHKFVKLALMLVAAALIFAVLFAASYGRAGYSKCVDGVDNMACTGAKLVKGTLGGQSNPHFIGMMPLLQEFQTIEDNLGMQSEMMLAVRGELDSTLEVATSLYLASQTVGLLRDALTVNFPILVEQNYHECRLCTTLGPVLTDIATALDDGAAAALKAARSEIDNQLSEENSAKLQKTFRSAADPLVSVKKSIRDSFKVFTDTAGLDEIRGHLDHPSGPNTVSHATLSIVFFALLVILCLICSCAAFVFRERAGKPAQDGGPKPYSKIPHRCACCSWCCGWLLMVIAFLFGGLMKAVGVPMSMMCLIMDDLSADLLTDIGPGLGLNLTGDTGEQLLGIVSNCLVPSDPNLNAALLDLVFIRDNDTSPKETLRAKVVDQVKIQIRSKFDDIDKQMAGGFGGNGLQDNSQVLSLQSLLSNNDMSTLIMAKAQELSSTASFAAMYQLQAYRDKAMLSSAQCLDAVVSQDVPSIGGQTVTGVESFLSVHSTFGTRQTIRADCADKVVCTGSVGSTNHNACEAANAFVQLKQNIFDTTHFRCDTFEFADATECDVLDMTGEYNSSTSRTDWSNDCLIGGVIKTKEKNCTLAEFNTYIKAFGDRINVTMGRVDRAVTEVGPAIATGLRNIVETYLIAPIDRIADGVTCGLMGSFYREMVDGFCYQGVRGFVMIGESYIYCAVFVLFAVIVMYAVWRRTIDNVNSTKVKKTKTVPIAIVPDGSSLK